MYVANSGSKLSGDLKLSEELYDTDDQVETSGPPPLSRYRLQFRGGISENLRGD